MEVSTMRDVSSNILTYTVGIDIGGTFTDIVIVRTDGRMYKTKVSSSFGDTVNGIVAGLRDLLTENGIAPSEVTQIVHGTTVATNAILEHKGALTGLLTTAGFRDVLEIGRLRRPSLYDIFWDKPRPLVRRAYRLELNERMNHRGEVQVELDPAEVREQVAALRRAGVKSVAITLLNSYANPQHEAQIAAIIREEHPDLFISVSTEILPEIREYERSSTTVVNAYIQPVVEGYLETLTREFAEIGLKAPLYIMQSNGGMSDSDSARRFPVNIVESGPAAGVLATSYLSDQTGMKNLIAFDMGGTTAKASLIEDGKLSISTEYEVGAGLNVGRRLNKGAGYPIRVPSVDIAEVGAGGGSIAWIDPGGAMQVGPQSAGAEPGPVCYGAGGTEPTVTDANVVLGYMNPKHLAGGRLKIDRDLAYKAIKEKVADPLGMSVEEAAHGIHTIANANMIRAVRAVTTERGRDPRDYSLVCFGGAGPIHAPAMALSLDIPSVIVPIAPGLFSAIGLHFADTTRDFVQTFLRRLTDETGEELRAGLAKLKASSIDFLRDKGFGPEKSSVELNVDVRFFGQAYELTIPIESELAADAGLVTTLRERFAREHKLMYGHGSPGDLIELVNLRGRAVGRSVKMPYRELVDSISTAGKATMAGGQSVERKAYFGAAHGFVQAMVLSDRSDLGSVAVKGPLIIEEFDTTVVIPPGATARLDELGNLVVAAQ
jgi:N-methylhydantoinase A